MGRKEVVVSFYEETGRKVTKKGIFGGKDSEVIYYEEQKVNGEAIERWYTPGLFDKIKSLSEIHPIENIKERINATLEGVKYILSPKRMVNKWVEGMIEKRYGKADREAEALIEKWKKREKEYEDGRMRREDMAGFARELGPDMVKMYVSDFLANRAREATKEEIEGFVRQYPKILGTETDEEKEKVVKGIQEYFYNEHNKMISLEKNRGLSNPPHLDPRPLGRLG